MKTLLLAAILLVTPAHAEMRKSWQDQAAEAAHSGPSKCVYWNCEDQEDWENRDARSDKYSPPYQYSEASLENAPKWLKLDCRKPQHRWAAYRHLYTMCR
jgi:hypothetical protein